MAREVAQSLSLPLADNVLGRKLYERKQTVLGRRDRKTNTMGSFVLADGRSIRGKNVLVIDDIITTGSTILACANALGEGGPASIYGLTWAAGFDREESKKTKFTLEAGSRTVDGE